MNIVQFKSESDTAQLSLSLFVLLYCCSRYVAFVELIHHNDLLDDVTFLPLTDQRPRKCDKTDIQTYRYIDRHFDFMTTSALWEVTVKPPAVYNLSTYIKTNSIAFSARAKFVVVFIFEVVFIF